MIKLRTSEKNLRNVLNFARDNGRPICDIDYDAALGHAFAKAMLDELQLLDVDRIHKKAAEYMRDTYGIEG